MRCNYKFGSQRPCAYARGCCICWLRAGQVNVVAFNGMWLAMRLCCMSSRCFISHCWLLLRLKECVCDVLQSQLHSQNSTNAKLTHLAKRPTNCIVHTHACMWCLVNASISKQQMFSRAQTINPARVLRFSLHASLCGSWLLFDFCYFTVA